MDILTPAVTGALLTLFTLLFAWLGKGQLDELRTDVRELRAEVREMRSDLTQVALAVGARSRTQDG